jgi:hypothetical protein
MVQQGKVPGRWGMDNFKGDFTCFLFHKHNKRLFPLMAIVFGLNFTKICIIVVKIQYH